MAKKVGILSYISGWRYQEDGTIDPVKVGLQHDETIVMDHTKRFHNCLYLLAGLTPCARNLMDWLTEEMSDTNIVYHTADSRKVFNEFIRTITNKQVSYADQSIKSAWGELSRAGLIIARPTRATFMVHPKFFWRGTDKDRILKIMAKITFDNKGVDNFFIFTNKKFGI